MPNFTTAGGEHCGLRGAGDPLPGDEKGAADGH